MSGGSASDIICSVNAVRALLDRNKPGFPRSSIIPTLEEHMAELFARDTIKKLRKLRLLKPDLFKSFMDFDEAVFKDGALPARTKELMAVTAAHVTQCDWCIEDHVKRAKKLGSSDEEIAEAAFVAMALRAGGAFAHSCITMAVTDEVEAATERKA